MENNELDKTINPQFVITKTYLGKFNMECHGTPELILNPIEKTIPVDTKTNVLSGKLNDNGFYMVEMGVVIESATDIGLKAHELSFVFIALVKINDYTLDDKCINRILNVIVPKRLFNNINAIVFTSTNATGYPVLLDKRVFEESLINNGTQDLNHDEEGDFESENADGDTDKINYKSIIRNLMKSTEIAEFFKAYNGYLGQTVTDDYENLPAYFYYLRFFIPIEYKHPEFDECDDSTWQMLFQLLFSNPDATCRIIDMEDDLPEIEFTYDYFEGTYVSELSLDDLKDLLDILISDMFVKTSIEMLDFKELNFPYSLTLNNDRLIHRNEFLKMFGYDKVELIPANDLECLEKMYSKLKNCDIQTVLYRY